MIQANNLSKVYNGVTVLDIQDIHIKSGESFGLVGNNGAGKTTFFRLILDLIKATTGEVLVDNINVAGSDAWKTVVGSFLDEGFLIDYLTPEEYFTFIGKLHGKSQDDLQLLYDSMKDFFRDEILGKKKFIRDFSKGNQKKIGIAAAIIGDPKILILDEPFTALDPSSQIIIKRFLNELQEQRRMTMLISSHDLNHITDVCQRIVILEKGKIVKDLHTDSDTLKELDMYFNV